MWGPFTGRRHDAELYRVSELLASLEEHFNTTNNDPYAVYADLAFPLSPHLQKPIGGAVLDDLELEFNTLMSSLRISIEWSFEKVTNLFKALNFVVVQRSLEIPVAKWYQVATLLSNCHTCLYSSQTSDYFDVTPPSLEEYLHD
jgi:hypothetical protein